MKVEAMVHYRKDEGIQRMSPIPKTCVAMDDMLVKCTL